ncbi:kinase-like protein [Stereum hirsutum FP-91666 SS1]|uniref:kinase-like protein n=1 Tax=Stereum hirsutum (strain FP-91666) TaxID=721885 RepID=UPI000444A2BC|nr:kinase-like protein [Stereum hirsutum FP-91666 SS1]EIM86823.1 kinase-like protein [Stereum hirsutum FP-91666 SS1]
MGDILRWIRRTANLSATRTELPWPGWLDADAARALTASSTTHQFTLSAPERQWVHIQPWLDSQGYLLRPRFRQGWTPSWPKSAMTNPLRLESRHEDAIQHDGMYASVIMDAVRKVDGRRVLLKRSPQPCDGHDIEILTYLSSEELSQNSRNHALPLLDTLTTSDSVFTVFPLLRDLSLSDFDTLGEGIDFMDQTLDGLAFLHEHRIAHRDCSMSNFVMDPGKMYPRGFHPDHVMRDARGRSLANVRTRTQAGGVKYFFIDFGESMRFGENEEPLVSVIRKASIFAPEMEDESVLLYDAYKADIYALGMTFELQFLKEYVDDFNAFKPLFDSMTQVNPIDRPTAAQGLEQLRSITATFSRTAMHRRLHRRSTHDPVISPIQDTLHMLNQRIWVLRTWKW